MLQSSKAGTGSVRAEAGQTESITSSGRDTDILAPAGIGDVAITESLKTSTNVRPD